MGMAKVECRIYDPASVAVFWKTRERFGGLSNMAAGFPLEINRNIVRTSEALYQACRFPHMPAIQREIVSQVSPMTAKMKAKPYVEQTRPDWSDVRVPIMRWCLKIKLCQNPKTFGSALLETNGYDIVEKKVRRSDFWGAKVDDDGLLKGPNVLGRLLMELRQEYIDSGPPTCVVPLNIPYFCFYGEPIDVVECAQESIAFNF